MKASKIHYNILLKLKALIMNESHHANSERDVRKIRLFIAIFPVLILFLLPFFIFPFVTMGDQPHYLLSASALLEDHTLNMRETYNKMSRGGEEAGFLFKGSGESFQHHTVIVDTNSFPPKESIAWWNYFTPEPGYHLPDSFRPFPSNYAEYSVRPPGWPIAIAILAIMSGLKVELSSLLLSHLAVIVIAIIVFLYLKKLDYKIEVAYISAITILVGSCYWIYANTAFADAFMGAIIALAIYSLRFKRVWVFAICLSLGVWFKYQFIFYAIGFILISIFLLSFKDVVKSLFMLFASALLMMSFHILVYGHFGPVTETAVESGNIFEQLNFAFLNPSTSILLRNPWAYSLVGILFIPFKGESSKNNLLWIELRFLSAVFLVLIIPVMFYGLAYYPLGWGWPGRTVMPILIVLAIAFGILLENCSALWCYFCLMLLAASVFIHLIAGFSDINLVHHYDWIWLSQTFSRVFH